MTKQKMLFYVGLVLYSWIGSGGCTNEDPWIVNSGIWVSPENSVYISGYVSGCGCDEAGFIKRNRSTIYNAPSGVYLWDIWGASSDELFAVSDEGVLRSEKGEWKLLSSDGPLNGLGSLHGSGTDHVFAVGQNGLIAFYNGQSVTTIESGTKSRLYDVVAISKNDVYAVGEFGTILHYDGITWSPMESGTTRRRLHPRPFLKRKNRD